MNSKSGDNQGVRFMRRFKQLLNPAQVFDLSVAGPTLGYVYTCITIDFLLLERPLRNEIDSLDVSALKREIDSYKSCLNSKDSNRATVI